MNRLFSACLAVTALTAAVAPGQTPVGTAFTYQGRLSTGGAPANGLHDLRFKLFNAPAGGAQVGGTVDVSDLDIVDGLVSTGLDFGAAAFNGDALWLEVAVFNPGSGQYVTLAPRQSVAAAPYALHALGSAQWRSAGSAIVNANTGFVGINRTTPVGGAECFGVQSPASGTEYGGMYMRTAGAAAKPFYGYSTGSETAWTYLDGSTDNWIVNNNGDRLTVEGDTGHVGINTTNPVAWLHIHSPVGGSGTTLYVSNYGADRAASFESHNNNGEPAVSIWKNGPTGLRIWANSSATGQPAPDAALNVLGGSDTQPNGGGFLVLGGTDAINVSIDNNEIMARNNGAASTLYLNNNGGDVVIAPEGVAKVAVLEITGGADLSERFEITGGDARPGMVVVIDAANPGRLSPATQPYDRRVAGIISGAGGVQPGMLMSQAGTIADGKHPVALTGRVYCLVDATDGAVEPGDLLTTSALPGHAMKVTDHARAAGAVIGKSMTALPKGERGLVLVLVSLQ